MWPRRQGDCFSKYSLPARRNLYTYSRVTDRRRRGVASFYAPPHTLSSLRTLLACPKMVGFLSHENVVFASKPQVVGFLSASCEVAKAQQKNQQTREANILALAPEFCPSEFFQIPPKTCSFARRKTHSDSVDTDWARSHFWSGQNGGGG